jgi:Kef-type K+ transport system membrane component KefB
MEHFQLHPLLSIGLLLLAGYAASLAANWFRLPRVTGYVVAGILLSPSLTGTLRVTEVEALLGFVSQMALAVIAFAIGGTLKMSQVKVLGKPILWITLTQGMGALGFGCLAAWVAGYFAEPLRVHGPETFLSIIVILGTISVATAPAATMAVVHELRARGPLTTTLLGIVALDDALTIILFSGAVGLAGALLGVGVSADLGLQRGLYEMAGALVIGAISGFIMSHVLARKRRVEVNLVAIVGAILLVSGFTLQFHFSPLMANMMMGFALVNYMRHADSVFHQLEIVEESLYCLFFVLAGAHFDLGVLGPSALLGLMLLLGRFVGKMSGAVVGGYLSRAPPQVRKYVGITLLPQAGLSLGLIFQTRSLLPETAYPVVLNALLASVILNEVISPPLVKWALVRAEEAVRE